jgi:lysophospholipase L1-like esterase
MTYARQRAIGLLAAVLLILLSFTPSGAADANWRIVTLGDSITKGVRPGVKADETFSALLESDLRRGGLAVEVINVGIGGERTDQALARLGRDVIARKPALVTIMYGTNDSYVDKGKNASRLTVEQYRANLEKIVEELRGAGIQPVLMTEPRWGRKAAANGVSEHPNIHLEKYVAACREVAKEKRVALIDHFQLWTDRESAGQDIGVLTTDQCHPNPTGHRLIADAMTPIVLAALKPDKAQDRPRRLEFLTMVAHWSEYGRPDYFDFIAEAKPELVQLGFYGAHFWSLVDTPQYKGYPAHFPVQGHAACAKWFAGMTVKVKGTGAKVIGHMNVKFLVGDPDSKEGPRGFFKFYRDLWDTELLGPKPVEDPLTMLEIDADGKPIVNNSYHIGGMHEYWACLNNPNWRKVLKAWTKHGIDAGVDGFIANYFYRHDCHCRYCVAGFKKYLADRFTPEQLKQQFAIDNLATHHFAEIVGWHDPKESTPLRREMLRWSQIANKEAFDDVFLHYGRSIKPDLIAAQWNHLGNFNQISGDERCMLPAELWGKGEDYLWYSMGAAGFYTDLKAGFLGEGTCRPALSAAPSTTSPSRSANTKAPAPA